MKHIISVIIMLAATVAAHAQNDNPLRDSLKIAMEKLSFCPDSVDLLLKKAAWNIQLEQWQYAKDSYDIVLRKEPANIAALYFRAFANERLGRYNFARLDYEHLLSVVPGNFQAQLGLALLNHKGKHYTQAMDMMNHIVTQFPDSAVAYAARANMEKERNLLELADYDMSKAIQIEPHNTDYIIARTDIRIKMKRWQDARRDIDTLLQLGIPKASLEGLMSRIRKKQPQ